MSDEAKAALLLGVLLAAAIGLGVWWTMRRDAGTTTGEGLPQMNTANWTLAAQGFS